VSSFGVQAVTRRRFPADGSPARQLLQPETTRAVMEMAGRPASGNDAMGHSRRFGRTSTNFRSTPDSRHYECWGAAHLPILVDWFTGRAVKRRAWLREPRRAGWRVVTYPVGVDAFQCSYGRDQNRDGHSNRKQDQFRSVLIHGQASADGNYP
jgi:hypothetical protein